MIKRILILIPLLVLTISCAGLEFVYNVASYDKIKNKTHFSITGDNKDIINSYLLSKIGEVENGAAYALSIVSNGSVEAAVVEADATASKFMIKHNLKYTFNNISKNCVIFEKNILTNILYDAKSAGYSFGTDLAEKELSEKNLRSNIDQFLNNLSTKYDYLDCKNEG